MEPDYSTYRLQLKSLNPKLDEKQIYQMYNGVMKPGRSTQTTPYIADDGYYHGLYLTECIDDGRIYIGKHSTMDLDDGYQGSGYEINDGKNLGKKFKTTWLEFFDSSDQAYVAEKGIVNANFIRNQKLVMNHVLGGKHLDVKPQKEVKQTPIAANKTEPKFSNPSPDRSSKAVKKGGSPFPDLGVKPGEFVSFIDDESQMFKVVDDWHVLLNGRKVLLKQVLKGITKNVYKNPLAAFNYNGRNLAEVQKELCSRK